ncbi:hypothetical protein CBL_20272 [Carabus blaptoides fortunei]
MGASWSSIAAGVTINYLFENNNLANGYREFYRDYIQLHGRQNRTLQELDRAARRMWRSLSDEVPRSVSISTTTYSAHASLHSSEYQLVEDLTPQVLHAQQLQPGLEQGPEPEEFPEESAKKQ